MQQSFQFRKLPTHQLQNRFLGGTNDVKSPELQIIKSITNTKHPSLENHLDIFKSPVRAGKIFKEIKRAS